MSRDLTSMENVRRRSRQLDTEYAGQPAPNVPDRRPALPWDRADQAAADREIVAARDRASQALVPGWNVEI